jgi:hypothetical protein
MFSFQPAKASSSDFLFSDDFGDGDLAGWTIVNGNWSVVNGELIQSDESSWPVIIWAGDKIWTNYALEVKVKPTGGLGHVFVLFRFLDEKNFYLFGIRENYDDVVWYKRIHGIWKREIRKYKSIEGNTWYDLRVEVCGTYIKGYVDDSLYIETSDADIQNGAFALDTHAASACFDNITVWSLEPRPDLEIADIFWSPHDPAINDTVSFGFTVRNSGTMDAGPFQIGLYINMSKIDSLWLMSLEVGESQTMYFQRVFIVKKGTYNISVIADDEEQVIEHYESNNIRSDILRPSFMYVLVSELIYSDIQSRLERYANDVESSSGLEVYVHTISIGTSSTVIRAMLQSAEKGLVGCLMVGDIAAAWYEYEDEIFPMDFFYMDLDGNWIDSDHDGKYDGRSGDFTMEIWVARLKGFTWQINDYFDRNHAYRMGNFSFPERALLYVDDDWRGTKEFDGIKKLYYNCTFVHDNATTCRTDYSNRLSKGWSLVHVMCHGWSGGHIFHVPDPTGKSIPEKNPVYAKDYESLSPPILFYNLFICSAARFTDSPCLGFSCTFSKSGALAVVGTTTPGSMRGEVAYDFYNRLSQGKTIGEAFKESYNRQNNPDWDYGMVILGDPNIKLGEKRRITIMTAGLNRASDVVVYISNGTTRRGSIVNGTWSDYCDHGSIITINNSISITPLERYITYEKHIWIVGEQLKLRVNYHHQYKLTIITLGLPSTATALVYYMQGGISKIQIGIWDENPFNEWCDESLTETLNITSPIIVGSNEQYFSYDTTKWAVTSAFTAKVVYHHAITHTGDLIIEAGEMYTIEKSTYTQSGDIILKDKATLIVKDAELILIQCNLFVVGDSAILKLRNVTISIKDSGLYVTGNISLSENTSIKNWLESNITRNFSIITIDKNRNLVANAELALYNKENVVWKGVTNDFGNANFNLTFSDNNYTATLWLRASYGNISFTKNITLLSDTPIVLKLRYFADLNDDGVINIIDIAIVARAFGSKPEDANWNPEADLNGDGVVNIVDVAMVAREFRKTV